MPWRWSVESLRTAWRERFHDLEPPVKQGYWVWSAVGIVIAIPELWAAVGKPPWPTISGTVGHLEARWNVVAVVVVAGIVVVAAHAVRFPLTESGPLAEQADRRKLGRTKGGHVTGDPATLEEAATEHNATKHEFGFLPYFLATLACVAGGSFIASTMSDNKWILGYVIYGLIAFFGVVIPSVLANTPTRNAPFAGLFPTIADLQTRLHFVGLIVLTGLVVLLIHLAFYPWPDVFRDNPGTDSP